MWSLRSSGQIIKPTARFRSTRLPRPACRYCLTRIATFHSIRTKPNQTRLAGYPIPFQRSASNQAAEADEYRYVSQIEADSGTLLETAFHRAEQYQNALEDVRDDMTVEEQKERSKVLKDLGPLAKAWESYGSLRKAILDTQANLDDPDPTMREMFAAEHEELVAELDNLITIILPQLLLPPLPEGALPALMTLTAGIGGGESARFVEEMGKMYTKYAKDKGWTVQVMSASEGAMAKGSGGNGFRELTLQFAPSSWAEEGAECFGELMWEKGTHRVQRVPPGATMDKMQSSTININVSPIYADTEEEPLIDPKDVREDTMRASGPGGQHVNKTESAIRLVHEPTGITVSMQDSRSQGQNRTLAWEVLRAKLSEKRRQEEQDRRNATRLDSIKHSGRGDKIRTYNWPQDRITDHRIGFSSSGLLSILSGENFGVLVNAMKDDLARRRMEALLRGEEDLLE